MPGPLEGLRVVDFTHMFAGPGTGMYLADMGADVIRVEPPRGGLDRGGGRTPASFLVLNRGKRSLALDIRTARGHEVVQRLVQRADVMLVAWPPGQAERLGCGYEEMHALNPRLVYASITGWGVQGPLAMKEGYDRLVQGYAGIMDNNRAPDGTPLATPFFFADMSIPMLLSYGIMLALWSRQQTGQGQKVEVSQLETGIAMQSIHLVFPEVAVEDPTPPGAAWRRSHTYRTQDGRYLVIVPFKDAEWARLWRCLELPELAADPRLETKEGRDALLEVIHDALSARFATRPLAGWTDILAEAEVPHVPVLSREELADQPHVLENAMMVEVDHPEAGRTRMMAVPVRLSATPGQAGGPSPAIGQHTAEILRELGYTQEDVDALIREGTTR